MKWHGCLDYADVYLLSLSFFFFLNSFNFFSPHAVRITAAFIRNLISGQDDLKTSHQRLWGRFVTNELIKTSILTSPKRSVSKTNDSKHTVVQHILGKPVSPCF